MPPKGPSKKTEAKAKTKAIEDKTFGMKNKNKSAKTQKYIDALHQTAKTGDRKARKEEEEKQKLRDAKKKDEEEKAELAKLMKPVVQVQKVPFGVDPKTVLCQYFKAGTCAKGDKCKFSHDVLQERKAAKINLYEDARAATGDSGPAITTQDSMNDWDQDKLEQVVLRKHGPGVKTTTEIVCKHFLDAIEQKKYGWFWECPNGGDGCKYKHALPPGFVLKSDRPSAKESKDEISLEEFLEVERYRIKKETPVTAESFAKWKLDRKRRAEEEDAKAKKVKEDQIRAGRLGNVSGRDLFVYQPDLFRDDEDATEMDYTTRADDDQQVVNDAEVFLEEDLENLEISDSDDQSASDDTSESGDD